MTVMDNDRISFDLATQECLFRRVEDLKLNLNQWYNNIMIMTSYN